jgi:hypothetical protein
MSVNRPKLTAQVGVAVFCRNMSRNVTNFHGNYRFSSRRAIEIVEDLDGNNLNPNHPVRIFIKSILGSPSFPIQTMEYYDAIV